MTSKSQDKGSLPRSWNIALGVGCVILFAGLMADIAKRPHQQVREIEIMSDEPMSKTISLDTGSELVAVSAIEAEVNRKTILRLHDIDSSLDVTSKKTPFFSWESRQKLARREIARLIADLEARTGAKP